MVRAWDDPLVNISSKLLDIALESGFTRQRAQNSLTGRLAILENLGLVRFAPGSGGRYTHALLMNPYLALRVHKKRLSVFTWNALLTRMNEVGADDFDPPKPKTEPAVHLPARPASRASSSRPIPPNRQVI